MGQLRHGCATTTQAMPKAIQRSQASIRELSRTYGINPKTVVKWRKRLSVEDRKTGPKEPKSTVLSDAEEAIVVAPHPAAAGRLPLGVAGDDPASKPLLAAPLPGPARHQPSS